jgi:hypothetical protein
VSKGYCKSSADYVQQQQCMKSEQSEKTFRYSESFNTVLYQKSVYALKLSKAVLDVHSL